jgi:hypothetical protein
MFHGKDHFPMVSSVEHFSRINGFQLHPLHLRPLQVPALPLQTLLDGLGWSQIDLLKLDCEGA